MASIYGTYLNLLCCETAQVYEYNITIAYNAYVGGTGWIFTYTLYIKNSALKIEFSPSTYQRRNV